MKMIHFTNALLSLLQDPIDRDVLETAAARGEMGMGDMQRLLRLVPEVPETTGDHLLTTHNRNPDIRTNTGESRSKTSKIAPSTGARIHMPRI